MWIDVRRSSAMHTTLMCSVAGSINLSMCLVVSYSEETVLPDCYRVCHLHCSGMIVSGFWLSLLFNMEPVEWFQPNVVCSKVFQQTCCVSRVNYVPTTKSQNAE